MNNRSFIGASIAMLVALALAITMSPTNIGNMETSYAQPTFDTPSSPGGSSSDTGSSTGTGVAGDAENFPLFMECLFGGEASEEDISNALDGSSETTPTEQEIRDCFAPLYNTGSAANTAATPTTTPPTITLPSPNSGSTTETQDAGDDEEDDDDDDDEEDDDDDDDEDEDEDEEEDD